MCYRTTPTVSCFTALCPRRRGGGILRWIFTCRIARRESLCTRSFRGCCRTGSGPIWCRGAFRLSRCWRLDRWLWCILWKTFRFRRFHRFSSRIQRLEMLLHQRRLLSKLRRIRLRRIMNITHIGSIWRKGNLISWLMKTRSRRMKFMRNFNMRGSNADKKKKMLSSSEEVRTLKVVRDFGWLRDFVHTKM